MKLLPIAAALTACFLSGSSMAGVLLSEEFDNIATLTAKGWTQTNNSQPTGQIGWFQGNASVFPARSGAPTSYIGANFLNADSGLSGTISNWLILPAMPLANAVTLSYFFRDAGLAGFPDTLEVRLSTNGSSTNVGSTATSVGDFTTLLTTITTDADTGWSQSTLTLAGLPNGVFTGRLAFRYVVPDVSVAGNYIGIDGVQVVPEPTSLALAGLALGGLAWTRRRTTRTGASA